MKGVSLDDLVYICTKLARQLDQDGVDSMFKAAESLSEALDIAQPLIQQVEESRAYVFSDLTVAVSLQILSFSKLH